MIVSRSVVKNIEVKEEVDFCVCDKCGSESEGILSGLGRLKPYKISGHKPVVLDDKELVICPDCWDEMFKRIYDSIPGGRYA